MSESAHVTSIEALVRLIAALRIFDDEVRQALLSLDQQADRALQWLDHDAPAEWRRLTQKGFDDVARARYALESCRMRTVAGWRPSCIDEQKALRRAKQQLEQAQQMVDVVRLWSIRAHKAVDEYKGPVGKLKTYLESELSRSIGLLERTVRALDGYTEWNLSQQADPPREP